MPAMLRKLRGCPAWIFISCPETRK